MITIFINKVEVVGTTMTTQYLSSRDLIEKSSISHFYISILSLEDASIGHGGDFHWVLCEALALRFDAECIRVDCSGSYEGLHVS